VLGIANRAGRAQRPGVGWVHAADNSSFSWGTCPAAGAPVVSGYRPARCWSRRGVDDVHADLLEIVRHAPAMARR